MDGVEHRKIGVAGIGVLDTLAVTRAHRREFGCVLQERVAQRRLPGTALPLDEHQAAFPARDIREALFEPRELVAMVHENG